MLGGYPYQNHNIQKALVVNSHSSKPRESLSVSQLTLTQSCFTIPAFIYAIRQTCSNYHTQRNPRKEVFLGYPICVQRPCLNMLPLRTLSASCLKSLHVNNNIRSLPNHLFRVMYALIVLVKTALLDNTSAEPSSSITYQDVSRAGPYLYLCLDKFVPAAGISEYRLPYLFAGIVIRLRKWYHY